MDDVKKVPAEPVVLWICPESTHAMDQRILTNGKTQILCGGEWTDTDCPALAELARRLLAERAEQEKLDDFNDGLERRAAWSVLNEHDNRLNFQQAAHGQLREEVRVLEERVHSLIGDAGKSRAGLERSFAVHDEELGGLDRRVTELDQNLAREVERLAAVDEIVRRLDADVAFLRDAAAPPQGAPPEIGRVPPGGLAWERGRSCMVDTEDKLILDLSDYDNLSPKDHDLLEKLADLWCAWGPEGYLRERLVKSVNVDGQLFPGWRDHPDFRQLRSELLAFVWKEGI